MPDKCVLCEFRFTQENGYNEMWSVLNHLADSHPYFTDEMQEMREGASND